LEPRPHVINALYTEIFDFPRREAPPALRYMVAAIPRSGSTTFCIDLWRTGVLGAPMEYINLQNHEANIARLGEGDVVAYWRNIQLFRTSPNGVFGFKSFVPNFKRIQKQQEALLPEIFCDEVVYLTRRDKLGQAISYARAAQTKVWFAGIHTRVEPKYSYREITGAHRWIANQEQGWRTIFERTQVTPIEVFHEDALIDIDPIAQRLADRLGVEFNPARRRLPIPGIEKQADDVSASWRDRFLEDEDRARRGEPVSTAEEDAAAQAAQRKKAIEPA